MACRQADHAGSWYRKGPDRLNDQLRGLMGAVPREMDHAGELPVPGARVIIAPHAGYSYSGPCAAYAYSALDLSNAKRIFILGPSHHHYLSTLALPVTVEYQTTLDSSHLPLDTELISKLRNSPATKPDGSKVEFTSMSKPVDEAEHSIEMQLPFIHYLLRKQFGDDAPTDKYPPLVPIMVGNTSPGTERAFGALLAPYVADPSNIFIISSDFCHWGTRFRYTYYVPQAPTPGPELPLSSDALPQPGMDIKHVLDCLDSVSDGFDLSRRDRISNGKPAIHESISSFDIATMAAITSGSHDLFLDVLNRTANTVCGRHPIGVIMAALEAVRASQSIEDERGRFRFLRYERSSDAEDVSDSSVSYVSAFSVL
ncbi:UPF0103/Mediator of ErbB2-driven cell motility (Memo-related) [Penicillium argentinense]|uniref:UPF0103/Mediator of ErbB2-driven cell motility (Memo-related) n=1 Tax=Penicillium argentinense TaxID=1131581 RepID=A0A9W9KEW0_9EURO|nr:UPF0103/Mediator of ErbB2-driven cell motility (Memo-related) [Penicillium argentinense]KAJ5103276.1 UPF0103/Mediator of ErbB2-driven cell motility (Memo-related) [Penicillium argentinense]